MRQKLTAVLMLTFCLLLASCGKAETMMQDALAFRTALTEGGGCAFRAEITAAVGERVYDFTLDAEAPTEEPVRIRVAAPESIEGISATLTATDARIEFDGTALDFGKLSDTVASPLYAPLIFAACWQSGYIDAAGTDGGQLRVTYRLGYGQEELLLETWLEGCTPVRCELYRDDMQLLSARVSAFTHLR